MQKYLFDFSSLADLADFYDAFEYQCQPPAYFGRNLDALWDVLTSRDILLPATFVFVNVPSTEQPFAPLVALMQQAEVELEGALVFIVHYASTANDGSKSGSC